MHMTMNKDWIYDETPPPIKTIRVANDKELRVESCGKVNIHVKSKNGSTNSIQRLGHLNYNDMKKLKDHTDGVTMPQNSELTCVPCIKGKQARSPFPCEGSRANQLLEIIHPTYVDLWRTAAYITNRTPTRTLNYKTPEEVWSGRKPDLSHMRIFGCEAMMHIPKEKLKKWDSKSCKMIFVGYCEDSKGYRLLDPKTKTVTKSRDVVFLENSIKTDTVPVTLSDTKKQQQVSRNSLSESSDCSTDISTHTAVESDDGDEEYVPEQSIGTPPTSNITLRPRNRPNPKVEPKSYLCMANVPQTYEDALSSEDSELWIKSIKEELKAHEDNGTWELVKKPDNVRLLDCKRGNIYETSEGLDVENSMACKLIKSLYGLKQAPRCWNAKFNSVLNKYGFFNSHADKCVEAVGSLMFAAIVTRPDIMFAVSTVSRFLNSHDQSHWNAVKKIFKYLKGTLSFGLCFRSNENNTLESYSDADANDPVTSGLPRDTSS
ncbi:Retrovirus-related Pol polyprotein from transposon TNT 1-94 [Eumeta japonica]|uniref:Retrovirus-related Pol polyprotein from transposon TNT 1-94 n=1 Tax=Eumeta variegata TaxID=151549 RepID=A0A4C1SJA9_EUMVA|nr:Retrovirus-related Pol polyprotein from transposon TNT 1-94 [Eumeta japonica]